jgi:putative Holliday junction resolvase
MIVIAVGQTITGSATPLVTLRSRNDKPDWDGIAALVREWQSEAFVVGQPFTMDDKEVEWSAQIHRFGRQLEGRSASRYTSSTSA